ncbi:MAG: formyl transferase [Planctomycetota bacterium]|nr:formyl transferase [Planctomycetota bacterium]
MNREISLQLFGSPHWPIPAATSEISDRDINRAASVRFFESLQPDVLLVCGAPILQPQIFSIPRIGTYNLHFGIAPEYRGQNTFFWAQYRRDYDKLGFTLHSVDQGVDTGDIWAHGYPALQPRDTEATLWAKSVQLAARLITEFLPQAEWQQLSGVPQGSGQNFHERDRTVWRDLAFLWNQSGLNRRLPTQPEKVERFFSCMFSDPVLSSASRCGR